MGAPLVTVLVIGGTGAQGQPVVKGALYIYADRSFINVIRTLRRWPLQNHCIDA